MYLLYLLSFFNISVEKTRMLFADVRMQVSEYNRNIQLATTILMYIRTNMKCYGKLFVTKFVS